MQHCDRDTFVECPNFEQKFFADKNLLTTKTEQVIRQGHIYKETYELYSVIDKEGFTKTFKVHTTIKLA